MKYIISVLLLAVAVWVQANNFTQSELRADTKAHEEDKDYKKPSDKLLKKMLTPLQYSVTQNDDTETPFKNKYWNEKRDGIYVDIVSGKPLFSSKDKYKSGTGWPSFTRPIEEKNITKKTDYLLLFPRNEIRSTHADSHLGHVFKDGPKPIGLRYCMNSAAMRFIAKEDLKKLGYEKYEKLFGQ